MNIGIIGGGMTGLAAAYRLCQQGHQVTVLEKGADLGGQAATFTLGAARLEKFYHHIFTSDVDIIQLIQELGVASRLGWFSTKVGFYTQGKIYNFVTPVDLLRFAPLNLMERLRLGLVSLYLQRQENWHKFERVTARQWLMEHAGKRSYEVVWSPLLRSKFGDSAEQISMAWLWSKLHLRFGSRSGGMMKEKLGYLDGSFGLLVDTLAHRIKEAGGVIYTNCPVERVIVSDGRVMGVEMKSPPKLILLEAVIATVPSPDFLKLVPGLACGYANNLEETHYQAAVCLVLVLKKSLSSIYWLNMGDTRIPFVAVIEHTNMLSPEQYGDRRIVYLSTYLSPDSPLYQLDQESLLQRYLPYLELLNPQFSPGWIDETYCFRHDTAQPVVTTDYAFHIPEHRTPIWGLYLANTTQIFPQDRGMNYSVRLGFKIAKIVADAGDRTGDKQ